MRRSEREIVGRAPLAQLLGRCKALRLAMVDNGKPYIVPMNYGFEWEGELPVLYLHSAAEGRKMAVLRRCPDVCFELDCDHALIPAPADAACGYGYHYSSIIGEGVAVELALPDQKRHALDVLMACQTDEQTAFTYSDEVLARTSVLKIEVSSLTGKAR